MNPPHVPKAARLDGVHCNQPVANLQYHIFLSCKVKNMRDRWIGKYMWTQEVCIGVVVGF